jgi:hypothetical protein
LTLAVVSASDLMATYSTGDPMSLEMPACFPISAELYARRTVALS